MSTIAARLERLPFSRFHLNLLVIGGLGYAFEAVDAAIIAFLMPILRTEWHLTSVQTGVLGSSTYVGFLVGALFAGMLGDRYGRRLVMMGALVLFCAASLASAFINDWETFLLLRIIGGVGMGAEGAIVAPFLVEFVSTRYRGAFTGALAGFFSFGFVAAALLGYFLIPTFTNGWRITLIVLACPVIVLLWWRRALMESPRWLESRGRIAEANAVVGRIESAVERYGYKLDPVAADATDDPPSPRQQPSMFGGLKALLSRRLRRVTIMSWCLWLSVTFSSYAFFTWIPGLLVQRGMTITQSFSYSILIYLAQIPGYFSAAYVCEVWDRRASIVVYMTCAALSAIGLAFTETNMQMLIGSIALSFFMNGVNASEYAYTPEVFPTYVRATGMGTASAIGRLGAIASPVLVGYIFPIGGFVGVFGMTTAVLAFGALSVVLLGVPTKGKSLEAIAAEELAA
ncbi:MAG TPA: MFS transporter [Rhodopila sp.]|uniref:MFS transporter n=1 Tax=Rhodopila sp. TaxID=2480087 RepID=UPI002B593762|nr:MFS transporter [Rhodopila sp.]HVY15591.1 MFS transporter [Rhodopila sp.]